MTSATTESPQAAGHPAVQKAVAQEVRSGLLSHPRTLSPWLFYDARGSELFEQITTLPEYYLTRTERSIFTAHADEIIQQATASSGSSSPSLTLIELGAGTATKTGILLAAAVRRQGSVVYQPVDVSETALDAASENILANLPGVTVRCQVADYTRDPLPLDRLPDTRTLALYIGSSIGNFAPHSAVEVLANLRRQLQPRDMLLLGTDLGPGAHKSVATLISAYDDAAGVTAAFNRNILARLNRDLDADFHPASFLHRVRWNEEHSRIEMHLDPMWTQHVRIPSNAAGSALNLSFHPGETVHTENSYKFTSAAISSLLLSAGFQATRTWKDPQELFAVTLAKAV